MGDPDALPPTAYAWADPWLVRTLPASGVPLANPAAEDAFAPAGVSIDQIRDVSVLQGPDYWRWTDSQVARNRKLRFFGSAQPQRVPMVLKAERGA